MALTGRTALLALLAAPLLAVAPGWPMLLGALAVLLTVAGVDLVLAGDPARLGFVRGGEDRVRLGEPATVTLLVDNPGGRRVRGMLRDAWAPSAGATEQRHLIDVPAGERRRLTTHLLPTRRGDRFAYRVTVRAVGPMGLAGRQRSHDVPWRVRVLPPFTSRKHLPSRLARLRELDGRTSVLVRGQGTEFDSVREYVVGDDVRSIDWRGTARRSEVVVRTWRPERDRHVLIVLDTSRSSAGRVGDAPRLDAALDAALLLGALASRAGDRVDLLAYDRVVRARVQGVAAADVLPTMVTAMAPLESSLVEVDAAGLVAAVLALASRRSLVVLLTGLDAAGIEEGLLPVLPALVKRHTVVLAAVADPRVAELAGGRGEPGLVYGAAAAEQARLERRRCTEVLRQRGVEVVDAPPDQLPPALADTYLALKAAGRL